VSVSKKSTLFVSVVIPVYNGEATIAYCLKCATALDYPREKFEIIMVDDGSTDKTVDVAKQHPVKVIQKEHTGYPSTMNAGIRVAKGEIVVNIDSDTYISKDWLIKVIEEFKEPKVGIASGYVATAPTSSIWAKLAGFEKEDLYDKIKSKQVNFITTTCTAYRRELFMEVGFFNESLRRGSDEELAHRALKAGWKIILRKDALCYHDWASSLTKYFVKHVLNMLYEVDSILRYPELLRGKDIAHPLDLYVPLALTFLLVLTPIWLLVNSAWVSILSLLGLILYHLPQTKRIIRKHNDWSMFLFPVVINIRYVAWLIGLAIGLSSFLKGKWFSS